MNSFDMNFVIALWTCTSDQTNLSTKPLDDFNLGLLNPNLTRDL